MMSPSPDGDKALLSTPYGGIEVFDNRAACGGHSNRLKNTSQPLISFNFYLLLSVRTFQTEGLHTDDRLIEGAVMEEQEGPLRPTSYSMHRPCWSICSNAYVAGCSIPLYRPWGELFRRAGPQPDSCRKSHRVAGEAGEGWGRCHCVKCSAAVLPQDRPGPPARRARSSTRAISPVVSDDTQRKNDTRRWEALWRKPPVF